MNNISYLINNPLYLSSLGLILNNNYLLLSQIPLAVTSIVYHHKIYPIRNIDIFFGQVGYLCIIVITTFLEFVGYYVQ